MDMVPGLEERLLEGSDEGVVHVAELVRSYMVLAVHTANSVFLYRSRKAHPVRGRMTQRA